MKKENKILLFGGIGLAVLTFVAFKVFAKGKKVTPTKPPKSQDEIDVEPEPDNYTDVTQVLSVITKSGTRLRSEPSISSEVLATYNQGVTLYVIDNTIKDDGLWYNVDDGEFLTGWVRSDVVDDLQVIRNY